MTSVLYVEGKASVVTMDYVIDMTDDKKSTKKIEGKNANIKETR